MLGIFMSLPAQVASDWKAARMEMPEADNAELILLPEKPSPTASEGRGLRPDIGELRLQVLLKR